MSNITEEADERYFIPPQHDLRCDWCKIEVSTPFIETNEGHIFCSEECHRAAMEQMNRKGVLACVLRCREWLAGKCILDCSYHPPYVYYSYALALELV